MKDLMFPVGISNFEKIREGGYYYIDKTNLISELLSGGIAEVTLITRPRRFGKSLGMSTLANFLDIRKDSKQMFEGLAISKNTELFLQLMRLLDLTTLRLPARQSFRSQPSASRLM